ncbi:MAG: purine-nucleoside phosphorylase [Lachnospiraceae bacterium]|nr:purine-nucleoside phosphorylase [Lachnospiraceae bacterium]MBR4808411.1 purine-nucleoside phosphorylase [Lachnospiraceae bacterium]
MSIPTPHNTAKKEDIAKRVLMPGDPLRAKFIAENFIDNARCVNEVRNMFAYTGTYKGEPVTIMGSGMGMPSIAIYSYELFNFYEVESIIRIGSAGAYADKLGLGDIVVAQAACTDSNFMSQYDLPGTFAPIADFGLLESAVKASREANIPVHVGNVVSSDIFYNARSDANDKWKSMGVLAVEMETAALYANAIYAGKRALGMFTISDHIYTGEAMPAKERQLGFEKMIKVALEVS